VILETKESISRQFEANSDEMDDFDIDMDESCDEHTGTVGFKNTTMYTPQMPRRMHEKPITVGRCDDDSSAPQTTSQLVDSVNQSL